MSQDVIEQVGVKEVDPETHRIVAESYQKCVSSVGISLTEKGLLQGMENDPILLAITNDLESLIQAEEDIISEYFKIIERYLDNQLKQTDHDKERLRAHFLIIVKKYLTYRLAEHVRHERNKTEDRKQVSLENLIKSWENSFGEDEALTTEPKIQMPPTNKGLKQTTMGVAAIQNLTPPPTAQPKRPEVDIIPDQDDISVEAKPAPPQQTPEPAIPKDSEKTREPEIYKKTSGTQIMGSLTPEMIQAQIAKAKESTTPKPAPLPQAPEPDPLHPIPNPTVTPKPPLGKKYKTEPGVPATEATIAVPAIESKSLPPSYVIVDTPPTENDQPEGMPIPDFKPQLRIQQDRKLYENPKLTIHHVFTMSCQDRNYTKPPTKAEWDVTMRNFQEEMANSFEPLRGEISSVDNLDEVLEQRVLQCLGLALIKVGNPQYRKRVMHEFFELVRSAKKPLVQRKLGQILEIALRSKPEFKEAIKPSDRIVKIFSESKSKPPKKLSPSIFQEAQDTEITEPEIQELPENMRRTVRTLTRTSRELGINMVPMSGITQRHLANLDQEAFAMMCHQTLNMIKSLEQKAGGAYNPKNWGGEGRKNRAVVVKLKRTLPAQMALMDQLLYSDSLFIPTQVQKLLKG